MLKIIPKIHDNRNSKNLIICFLANIGEDYGSYKFYIKNKNILIENKRLYAKRINVDFMYFEDNILKLLDDYFPNVRLSTKEELDYIRICLNEYFEEYDNIFYVDFDVFLFGDKNVFDVYKIDKVFTHIYDVVYPWEHTLEFFTKLEARDRVSAHPPACTCTAHVYSAVIKYGFNTGQMIMSKKAINKIYNSNYIKEFFQLKEERGLKEEFTGLEHYLVWLQNFKLNTKLGDIFQNMNCDWKIENFGSKMVHNQDLSEETLLESINENVFVIHPLGKLKEKLISRLCNIHQRLNNE